MTFPRMRTLIAFVLLCPLAALATDDREHAIPPNQQHGGAQASLAIRVIVVPAVLPPRHKDHDGDEGNDRRDSVVIYNLLPAAEQFSITSETRGLFVDGRQEPVKLTTVVAR